MIIAIYFGIAYFLANKFCPFVKGVEGHFIPLNFIFTLGLITGLIDGIISFLINRKFLDFIVSPIIYIITTAVSWYICTLLPWTKDQAGFVSTGGFLTAAIILTALVGGFAQALKK